MANSVKRPKMVRVLCNQVPVADILKRQPKSPGMKAQMTFTVPPMAHPNLRLVEYVINQDRTMAPPEKVWANEGNLGHRCTRCGLMGHPVA
jgi:hypothetical protein